MGTDSRYQSHGDKVLTACWAWTRALHTNPLSSPHNKPMRWADEETRPQTQAIWPQEPLSPWGLGVPGPCSRVCCPEMGTAPAQGPLLDLTGRPGRGSKPPSSPRRTEAGLRSARAEGFPGAAGGEGLWERGAGVLNLPCKGQNVGLGEDSGPHAAPQPQHPHPYAGMRSECEVCTAISEALLRPRGDRRPRRGPCSCPSHRPSLQQMCR